MVPWSLVWNVWISFFFLFKNKATLIVWKQPQKPELIIKRKGDENDDDNEPAVKRRKGAHGGGQTQEGGNDPNKILQMMDEVPEVNTGIVIA